MFYIVGLDQMRWAEIREQHPGQWLIIEALKAHTTTTSGRRKLEQMAVVKICPDGAEAYQQYRELHRQYPLREFYFVHTARQELDIRERQSPRPFRWGWSTSS